VGGALGNMSASDGRVSCAQSTRPVIICKESLSQSVGSTAELEH
jgi:hypothetical protein